MRRTCSSMFNVRKNYVRICLNSNSANRVIGLLGLMFDVWSFEANNRVFEFDYQNMNTFESVLCLKNGQNLNLDNSWKDICIKWLYWLLNSRIFSCDWAQPVGGAMIFLIFLSSPERFLSRWTSSNAATFLCVKTDCFWSSSNKWEWLWKFFFTAATLNSRSKGEKSL